MWYPTYGSDNRKQHHQGKQRELSIHLVTGVLKAMVSKGQTWRSDMIGTWQVLWLFAIQFNFLIMTLPKKRATRETSAQGTNQFCCLYPSPLVSWVKAEVTSTITSVYSFPFVLSKTILHAETSNNLPITPNLIQKHISREIGKWETFV